MAADQDRGATDGSSETTPTDGGTVATAAIPVFRSKPSAALVCRKAPKNSAGMVWRALILLTGIFVAVRLIGYLGGVATALFSQWWSQHSVARCSESSPNTCRVLWQPSSPCSSCSARVGGPWIHHPGGHQRIGEHGGGRATRRRADRRMVENRTAAPDRYRNQFADYECAQNWLSPVKVRASRREFLAPSGTSQMGSLPHPWESSAPSSSSTAGRKSGAGQCRGFQTTSALRSMTAGKQPGSRSRVTRAASSSSQSPTAYWSASAW